MKFSFLVILFIINFNKLIANQIENQKFHRKVVWECIKSTKIPWSSIYKFKSNDFNGHDSKSKEFTKCFAKKVGIIDINDEIIEEMLIKYLLTIVKSPLIVSDD